MAFVLNLVTAIGKLFTLHAATNWADLVWSYRFLISLQTLVGVFGYQFTVRHFDSAITVEMTLTNQIL